ncbi:MAG: galactokinase [Clostridia bacterium]|nr:galactokinase [Clostridia bacterium]
MRNIKDLAGKYEEHFNEGGDLQFFSAPGRIEIGGNHTDHQHGCVLASSINKDSAAAVQKRDDTKIRILAESFGQICMDSSDLKPDPSQKGTTAALIKGVLSYFEDHGYRVGGFNAYTVSDVLIGAGLSSSASYETLIGVIISHLFNDGKADPIFIAKAGQFAENVFFGKPCGLMDQMASSVGGPVFIDFKDPNEPVVRRIGFDFASSPYDILITDTKGSHADLTHEYAAIPSEMTSVAKMLGHDYLRDVSYDEIIGNIGSIRSSLGDRAVLRALHFIDENKRAQDEAKALENNDLQAFIDLVRESGNSSYKYLQNIYSPSDVRNQGMSLALCISDRILGPREASRVHGGGFAGTTLSFVLRENTMKLKSALESVFGEGACEVLSIRNIGGTQIKNES